MKIKQTNLGLIIEKSQAVQSVIDSYTKLEELKPEGVSRRILDLQRVNINPNNVRRLIFSENVFNQIAKVKVGEDFDFRLLHSLPNRKDTYFVNANCCVRYTKQDDLIVGLIFNINLKDERVLWNGFGIDTNTGSIHYSDKKIMVDEQYTNYVDTLLTINLYSFLRMLVYTELSDIETRVIQGNGSYGTRKNGKIKNESNTPITMVDTSWNIESIRITGFMVNGHYRMQRCGKGYSQVMLKWIDAFEKKGYTRRAKKEMIN